MGIEPTVMSVDPSAQISEALDVVYGSVLPTVGENALDILFLEADASLSNQDYSNAAVLDAETSSGDEDHDKSMATSTGLTASRGVKITVGSDDLLLTGAKTFAGVTATKCYVLNDAGTTLATADVTGTEATFSTPYLLSAGGVYRIEFDAAGAEYDFSYLNSMTYSGSVYSITGGSNEGADVTTGYNFLGTLGLTNAINLDFTPTKCYVYVKGVVTDQDVTLKNLDGSTTLAVTPQTETAITFKPFQIAKGSNDITGGGFSVFFWGGS